MAAHQIEFGPGELLLHGRQLRSPPFLPFPERVQKIGSVNGGIDPFREDQQHIRMEGSAPQNLRTVNPALEERTELFVSRLLQKITGRTILFCRSPQRVVERMRREHVDAHADFKSHLQIPELRFPVPAEKGQAFAGEQAVVELAGNRGGGFVDHQRMDADVRELHVPVLLFRDAAAQIILIVPVAEVVVDRRDVQHLQIAER